MGMAMVDRRAFLENLGRGAAGLCLAGVGAAASLALPRTVAAAEADLKVTPLAEGLVLISGAGGNAVALRSREGVLLVDGGDAAHSAQLLKTVKQALGGAVSVAFNTHWHWDHTGSNEALRRDGVRLIAHENTRLWFTQPVNVEWEKRLYPPRPKALPTQTFYKGVQKLTFGDATVEYGYLPQAHTDGDIYIYFREANVLVAGGVVTVGSYPIPDSSTGGWTGGLANATQTLLGVVNDQTRIVPDVGPVQSKADLTAENEMLTTLHEEIWQMMRKGMGVDDMIAAGATGKFDARWGNSDLFIANAYRGIYGHVREMRGIV
jgi:glyoxylase-like metal-dependent hydrolase (beta-lactamase superfamily II)